MLTRKLNPTLGNTQNMYSTKISNQIKICIVRKYQIKSKYEKYAKNAEYAKPEVWEINVRQIIIIANGINSQTPKLQRALAWVLDELERN